MNEKEVRKLIQEHQKYIENPKKGKNASVWNKDWTRIDIRHANLTKTYFRDVDFSNVNFSGVNLAGANFYNSDFTNASFNNANLYNAYFSDRNKNLTFEPSSSERHQELMTQLKAIYDELTEAQL
jgi:uncharacterized protein YjbI with pentapeptide repeats